MPLRDRLLLGGLLVLLLTGAAVVWTIELRTTLVADPTSLDGLPDRIGMWAAVRDIPIDPAAEELLQADYHVQRVYYHPVGGVVAVYVGYYGTARGGRPEHTPDICYPSSGWAIEARQVVEVDPERGLRAIELDTMRAGDRQLVHYYFRSHRDTGMVGVIEQALDRILGQLTTGRGDGALVRVSMESSGPADATARSRLIAFASELDPILDGLWPEEQPAIQ